MTRARQGQVGQEGQRQAPNGRSGHPAADLHAHMPAPTQPTHTYTWMSVYVLFIFLRIYE